MRTLKEHLGDYTDELPSYDPATERIHYYLCTCEAVKAVKAWLEEWKKEIDESVRAPLLVAEKRDTINDLLEELDK
jgi:hypothetical protein